MFILHYHSRVAHAGVTRCHTAHMRAETYTGSIINHIKRHGATERHLETINSECGSLLEAKALQFSHIVLNDINPTIVIIKYTLTLLELLTAFWGRSMALRATTLPERPLISSMMQKSVVFMWTISVFKRKSARLRYNRRVSLRICLRRWGAYRIVEGASLVSSNRSQTLCWRILTMNVVSTGCYSEFSQVVHDFFSCKVFSGTSSILHQSFIIIGAAKHHQKVTQKVIKHRERCCYWLRYKYL